MPEVASEQQGSRVERVVHDLACPLTIIRAACFELGRDESDPQRLRRLEVIDREAERLGAGLAALGRDDAPAATQRVGVADLVAGVVARFDPVARREGKVITGSLGMEATVHGDVARLERALDNLAVNALRHGRKRVIVSLAGCDRGDRVAILVADDGPGVPADDRERIFSAGCRGRAARGAGRGLGLAIAEDVAAEHGGTLRLMPSASGALFSLNLPLAARGRSSRGAA